MVGKKKIMNRKGSALIIVMLIVTVGLMFSAVLMNYTTTSYRRTMSDSNIEMAYYGSDSALEKSIDYTKSNVDEIIKSTPYTDDDSYANSLATNLFNALKMINFDEIVDVDNTDKVVTKVNKVDMLEYSTNPDNGNLQVLLGISADSNIKSGIFNAGNKDVYYKIMVEVKKPLRFYLNSAINTIGDIYIDGGEDYPISGGDETNLSKYNYKVYIDGDVNVYGTTPINRSIPQQWYYGGVMVQNNAYLKIDGSAYCRSLIRAGLYDKSLEDAPIDKSRIDITGDAITQGIQIFGREDKVVVQRDAYTFDDLEINGPDSVIAVNGSYFGVSNGKDDEGNDPPSDCHDLSSAIVNSATVHDLASDAKLSKKSRVVINGDVFINGGTFKLDDNGVALGQIEDAAVAWDTDADVEMYRGYDKYWSTLRNSYVFDDPPFDVIEGKSYLKKYKDKAVGFGALFQMWPDQSANINNWLVSIDNTRNYTGDMPNNGLTASQKDQKISGYSKTVVAANDSLKFMDKLSETSSGIEKFNKLNKENYPDQIEELKGFWKDDYDLKDWLEYSKFDIGIPKKLDDLKKKLIDGLRKNNAEFFVQRKIIGTNPQICHSINTGKDPTYKSYFSYMLGVIKNKANVDVSGCSIGYISGKNKLSDYSASINLSKYQIFVSDSSSDLIVDTNFNGLIITKGRVVIGRGCTINGSIIAAGSGFDGDSPAITSSVNETNLSKLNNGDYAAVYFDSKSGTGDSTRITFSGRDDLLDKILSSGGPDLKSIL